MRLRDGTLVLAPTDIAHHLACRHLTQLDIAHVHGRLTVDFRPDPRIEALQHRGRAHEAQYIAMLEGQGLSVVDLRNTNDAAATVAVMAGGCDVIVQAPLERGRVWGRADVLRRVAEPHGTRMYEPADTKLTRDTRAGTIIQLSTYAVLLEGMQGILPEHVHVVTPLGPEQYRTAEFSAYFRLIRRRLEADLAATPPPATYPHPVAHCDVCRYWLHCDGRLRADDHPSLVAGISVRNVAELARQGITTVAALAAVDGGLPERPRRGAPETYVKLAHQARLQVRARETGIVPYELLAVEPRRGLARLPEPSVGDVFLDFEGDRFFGDGGLEYLTGWAFHEDGAWQYAQQWALARADERTACEAFLDFVAERLDRHPDLHVYHFGAYEPAALKRLVARHATRADTLDRLLRGGRFVDLHAAVREGVRIGIERYGLKEIEPLTGFRRAHDLRDAALARIEVEVALETGDLGAIDDELRVRVAAYNNDDCLATLALRDWLEARRRELDPVPPRPESADDAPSDEIRERDRRIQEAADALLADVPPDANATNPRWLLAHMLGYFRREEKCAWWEHFRLCESPYDELVEEREAVAGLEFVAELPKTSPGQRVAVHRYRFAPQETALDAGDRLRAVDTDDPGAPLGTVEAIDLTACTIDIRKRRDTAEVHPSAVFCEQVVPAKVLESALLEMADHVRAAGLDGDGRFRAARDLLCRRPPHLRSRTGGPLRRAGEDLVNAAVRLCRDLDGGVLPIQGPPGAGKTYVGARAIVSLVEEGRRVGVTAGSHKVIDNLLGEVVKAAKEAGVDRRVVHKTDDDERLPPGVEAVGSSEALAAVAQGAVVGGTAWLWASDDADGVLDYLFVDEAGQMALACVLAAARATRNLVLLGDPQQLEQPRRGAHPDGTDIAALVHVLGAEHATIDPKAGLFLDRTWRLHPTICRFTSETYYDGRLEPVSGLEAQQVTGAPPFGASGLYLVEVVHNGNQASAPEEVDAVERVVRALIAPGIQWTSREGVTRALTPDDVLVVAPYNAQVAALCARLHPIGVNRVGTVDKFQGQEAPAVVYSCTSSSAEDAPRGMDFLYDPHRFNVATSRARALVIVVASPRIFTAECRTPAEMRMINGLCRFRELATVAGV